MGDIYTAFRGLFGHEGVYDNDPDDPGGETVYGVSRKFWPHLVMWEKIDRIKGTETSKIVIAKKISEDTSIMVDVHDFYKKEFWNPFNCDLLPQEVAYEIFEQAVNIGRSQCTKHIQKALNVLNRDGILWRDLVEDGKFGANTFRALNETARRDSGYLVGILNILQGAFYVNLGREKYIRGWIKRAQWVYK